jgi:hypothetical protein
MNTSADRRPMKGIGRVTFIAHLAEITAELDAGWPLKAVYENRRGCLGISYVQFSRYVDRIIRRGARGQTPLPPSQPARPESDARVWITASGHPKHAACRAPRTFERDLIERPEDHRRVLGED